MRYDDTPPRLVEFAAHRVRVGYRLVKRCRQTRDDGCRIDFGGLRRGRRDEAGHSAVIFTAGLAPIVLRRRFRIRIFVILRLPIEDIRQPGRCRRWGGAYRNAQHRQGGKADEKPRMTTMIHSPVDYTGIVISRNASLSMFRQMTTTKVTR